MRTTVFERLMAGVVAVLALAAGSWAAERVADADGHLKIALALDVPAGGVAVGDTLKASIEIENSTKAPLKVLDWDKWHDVLWLAVEVTGYPGEAGIRVGHFRGMPWGRQLGSFRMKDYRELPPGKTVLPRDIVFMIPGKAVVDAGLLNDAHYVREEDQARGRLLEDAWQGEIVSKKAVTVSGEMAAAMKARYEAAKKKLQASETSADERRKILAEVAAEKHYFAARFLREACESLPTGDTRDAAIGHLAELAKFGTAYESASYLAKVSRDESVSGKTRQIILEELGMLLEYKGSILLAGQADYQYPKPVLEEARAAVLSLSTGRDPYLAAQAREILKKLEEKEKKEKEASKPPAK
jgi:hypothetical protein